MRIPGFFLILILVVSIPFEGFAQNTALANGEFLSNIFAGATQRPSPDRNLLMADVSGSLHSLTPAEENLSRNDTLKARRESDSTTVLVTAVRRPCQEPAKPFSSFEYSGPFSKLTERFSGASRSTSAPKQDKTERPCSLDTRGKFLHFVKSTVDLDSFVGAAANAGMAQWAGDDPQWGQGAAGYGKRYVAAFVDNGTSNFFSQFFYPALFREDQRYYAQHEGSARSRFGHALAHSFVARTDSGKAMPNLSLWAGTASAEALGNLYHPGSRRGFWPAAQWTVISIGSDMGMDVLAEFWPEVIKTFRLPFRERQAMAPSKTRR